MLLHPLFVFFLRLHDQLTVHPRVAKAAKLSAGHLELTGLRGFKPGLDFPPRHGVLLEAQVGEEEAVNHVFGFEDDVDYLAHGDMQLIVYLEIVFGAEFSIRPRIGDFPIELLSRDLNHEVAGWHLAFDFRPYISAAKIQPEVENKHGDAGDENPRGLPERLPREISRFASLPAPVANQEEDNKPLCQDEPCSRDVQDQIEKRVYVAAESRYVLWKPVHIQSPLKFGFLLSRKASVPSFKSCVMARFPKQRASSSRPELRSTWRPRLMTLFDASMARRGSEASLPANCLASSNNFSFATTFMTSPMARACSALMGSPVKMISLALVAPMSRGSLCVPPPPGNAPILISGRPNLAVSEAMRKSHANASSHPPPSA